MARWASSIWVDKEKAGFGRAVEAEKPEGGENAGAGGRVQLVVPVSHYFCNRQEAKERTRLRQDSSRPVGDLSSPCP